MKVNTEWKDYEVIASGNGEKLERWGDVILLRPDPQVIWKTKIALDKYKGLNARYNRSSAGGGGWVFLKETPAQWTVAYKNLKFFVKPMGFKHTGLFPEQAVNWEIMTDLIKKAERKINVLNLFGYTGGATVACLAAGADVCHVDAAKNMVDRCRQNVGLSGLTNTNVRYIVDDCRKFVTREIKRGNVYDAIIMDPPSYGRGANGEVWKIEDNLHEFVELCFKVLSKKPLFVLINSYTTGLGPTVMSNILQMVMAGFKGKTENYELCLPTSEGIYLPCGNSAIWVGK